jgi:hypothetical protein
MQCGSSEVRSPIPRNRSDQGGHLPDPHRHDHAEAVIAVQRPDQARVEHAAERAAERR